MAIPLDLPCRATVAPTQLLGGLPLLPLSHSSPKHLHLQRCAVVGSADTLRLEPRGREIDAHDVIFRLNNAPTAGWDVGEAAVGSRTSVRVVNHVPIEKWILRATNGTALRASVDGSEYAELLCAPGQADLGCVVSLVGRGKGFGEKLQTYRRLYPAHSIQVMSEALLRYGTRCNHELHGTAPSGGLLTVLLASATCAMPISLYGFWPFCCHAHHGWPAMNYKYSQGNRTAWVCCSKGREKMELEYAWYQKLARRGLVRLVGDRPAARVHEHQPDRVYRNKS